MRIKKEIEEEVEKTLNSLEGMRSASPGPFFFTRTQWRLHNIQMNVWEKISAFIARPTIAMAVIFSVILMNTLVFIQQDRTSPPLAEQSEQQVYEDFYLADNAFSDYENLEP